MIRPTKHSHPDRTVVYASTVLLRHLMTRRILPFEDAKKYVVDHVVGGDYLFLASLNLLFLLGLISYHTRTDSIEFINL
jgi:hypothetical protein